MRLKELSFLRHVSQRQPSPVRGKRGYQNLLQITRAVKEKYFLPAKKSEFLQSDKEQAN
jgi:hypothetical protein